MKLVIDRFEGKYAVCEDLETYELINIEKTLLPVDSREGMLLAYEDGNIQVDVQGTDERAKQIKKKMDDLWE